MFSKRQLLLHLFAEVEALRSKPGSKLSWRRKELMSFGVQFGEKIWIGSNFYIHKFGDLVLGERCALGENTQIFNHTKIIIGDDFISASDLIINSGSHDPTTLIPFGAPIEVGDRVWCGSRVTIIAGVKIGSDVVIGAGSVVTKDLPSNCIAVGVPAKPVKLIDRGSIEKLWSWS